MEEHLIDEPITRKGKGIYCSLVTVVFTILTVCVLITAAILMTYYIPRKTEATTQNASDDLAQRLMRGRLPKTVLPRRYEVNLRPFLYQDDVVDSELGKRFTFDGWVRITVECIEPTEEITLHSENFIIHGMPTVVSVSNPDRTDIFDSYKVDDKYAFMVLKLKQMLMPHQEYNVYVKYSGFLRDDLTGFYPSKYLDSSNNTRLVLKECLF